MPSKETYSALAFVAQDPVYNEQTGKFRLNISIGTKAKSGKTMYNYRTVYASADYLTRQIKALSKGDEVYVEGHLWCMAYTDKSGQAKGQIAINASLIMKVDWKKTDDPIQSASEPDSDQQYQSDSGLPFGDPPAATDPFDDIIP